MKKIHVLLWCVFVFCGSAVAAQSSEPPVAFQVGDAVRITVFRNADLGGTFDIAEDGTVISPVYRSIRMAGMTLPQAEAAIRTVLQQFVSQPQFVVEPLFRVAVSGEVRSPNIYTVAPYTTVPQAVAQAGGPTERARVNRVKLLRDGQEIDIDLTLPYSELTHMRLRAGDQIIMERDRSVWRDYISPVLSTVSSMASLAYVIYRAGNLTGAF